MTKIYAFLGIYFFSLYIAKNSNFFFFNINVFIGKNLQKYKLIKFLFESLLVKRYRMIIFNYSLLLSLSTHMHIKGKILIVSSRKCFWKVGTTAFDEI